MEKLQNFLQVNGKIIVFLNKNGVYYIALKPICQALNVNYIEQYKDTKLDSILGPELCKHTMQVPGDQARAMQCLPEKYIYGWIFSIKSKSPELLEYKRKCYDVLYDYFHGTLTQRKQLLQERNTMFEEITTLSEKLQINPDFTRLNELRAKNMRMEKDLKKLDELLTSGQKQIEFN